MPEIYDEKLFVPIKPESLRLGTTPYTDVFRKKPDNTMVPFHRGGQEITEKFQENLIDHKVVMLFVHKSERKEYLNYIADNLKTFIDAEDLHENLKIMMTHSSISVTAEMVIKDPQRQIVSRFISNINSALKLISKKNDAIFKFIKLAPKTYSVYNHLTNVGFYATALALDLFGADESVNMSQLCQSFFLHDIGFHGIPLSLIYEKHEFSEEDWKIMKTHPVKGVKLLKEMNLLTEEAMIVVLQHHERYDGAGYPQGLAGEQISNFAKICAIADVYDSLTAHRPYRKGKPHDTALQIIRNELSQDFADGLLIMRFEKLFDPKYYQNIPDFRLRK